MIITQNQIEFDNLKKLENEIASLRNEYYNELEIQLKFNEEHSLVDLQYPKPLFTIQKDTFARPKKPVGRRPVKK